MSFAEQLKADIALIEPALEKYPQGIPRENF